MCMNVSLTLHLVASHAQRCSVIPICSEFTLELFLSKCFGDLPSPLLLLFTCPPLVRFPHYLSLDGLLDQMLMITGSSSACWKEDLWVITGEQSCKTCQQPQEMLLEGSRKHKASIIIILPTTLMRNVCILQCPPLYPPGILQSPVEDTSPCTNIQECGSQPDLWLTKENDLQNSVEEDEGKDQKEPTFCVF